MKTSRRALVLVWGLIIAGCSRTEAPLPRYHYTPGEVLEYEGGSVFSYQNGKFISTSSEKIWVESQKSDGSWVLLVRAELKRHRDDARFKNPDETRVYWMRTTAFPDGHWTGTVATNPESAMQDRGRSLPADAKEMKSGWESKSGDYRAHSTVLPEHKPGQIIIRRDVFTPTDAIYFITNATNTTFDVARGLRLEEDNTDTQGYGFIGKSTGTMKLKSISTETPERIKQLDGEFGAYMSASKSTGRLIMPDLTPAQIDAAAKTIETTFAKVRTVAPDFGDLIDKQLTQIKQSVSYEKENAQKCLDLRAAPTAVWSATDLKGASHALVDYRGKVVVLDFWYRGCGWCMLAMPQVIDTAAQFAGRPVVFLGMSIDDPASKDADFVVDKMKITYPVLHAEEIAASYKINAYPTLLVLDQKGVVRFIHAGYDDHLGEQIKTSVETLLRP